MAALAYVEVLDRCGELLHRHAVTQLPCRIGRGYDVDVLIDDSHADAAHLVIEGIKPEGVLVRDLGSVNGTRHLNARKSFKSGVVLPDDVLRLGQTQIRIRSCHAPVAEALPIRRNAWREQFLTSRTSAAAALMLFLVVAVAGNFLETTNKDVLKDVFFGVISLSMAVAAVVILSAVINRIFGEVSHFVTHVTLVCLGFVAIWMGVLIIEYVFFAFDMPGAEIAKWVIVFCTFSAMFYLQLGFITRATRLVRLITVLILSGGLGGLVWMDKILDPENHVKQHYNTTIKPGVFLVVPGVKPAVFFEQVEELKSKVDGWAENG